MNVYFLRSAIASALCLVGAVVYGQDEPKLADPLPPADVAPKAVEPAIDDAQAVPRSVVEPRDADRDREITPRELDRQDNRRDDLDRRDGDRRDDDANVDNRWRFKFHNGEWWYWTTNNAWKIHRNGAWMDYDPATYRRIDVPVYTGANTTYYDDGYYSGGYGYSQPYYRNNYYGSRYYGGYGYPGYYNRGYGYGGYGRGYGYGGNGVYFGNRDGGVYIGNGGIGVNTGRGGWGGGGGRGRGR